MSYTDAIEYLKDYREERAEALQNKQAVKWFTEGVGSVSELIEDIFNSDDDNTEWEELWMGEDGERDITKLFAAYNKIHFTAGCRHSVRAHFAVGSDNAVKTPADYDRHAITDMHSANTSNSFIGKHIEVLEGGID